MECSRNVNLVTFVPLEVVSPLPVQGEHSMSENSLNLFLTVKNVWLGQSVIKKALASSNNVLKAFTVLRARIDPNDVRLEPTLLSLSSRVSLNALFVWLASIVLKQEQPHLLETVILDFSAQVAPLVLILLINPGEIIVLQEATVQVEPQSLVPVHKEVTILTQVANHQKIAYNVLLDLIAEASNQSQRQRDYALEAISVLKVQEILIQTLHLKENMLHKVLQSKFCVLLGHTVLLKEEQSA